MPLVQVTVFYVSATSRPSKAKREIIRTKEGYMI
jgi:hypothetical protein